jgi:hypothetical protein
MIPYKFRHSLTAPLSLRTRSPSPPNPHTSPHTLSPRFLHHTPFRTLSFHILTPPTPHSHSTHSTLSLHPLHTLSTTHSTLSLHPLHTLTPPTPPTPPTPHSHSTHSTPSLRPLHTLNAKVIAQQQDKLLQQDGEARLKAEALQRVYVVLCSLSLSLSLSLTHPPPYLTRFLIHPSPGAERATGAATPLG